MIVTFRITPAGAGKTLHTKVPVLTIWDHPRRCGENFLFKRILFARIGSPPQVRGKRWFPEPDYDADGITPAGAGKTECSRG